MKGSSVRAKGQSFERQVASDLLKALAALEPTKKEIYRTPLSGGHPFADKGDLCISERLRPYLPFAVECKHQKIWKPGVFLGTIRKNEEAWLRQVEKATEGEKIPLLVMSGNSTGVYAALPRRHFNRLFPDVLNWGVPHAIFQFEGRDWKLLPWETFLQHLTECLRPISASELKGILARRRTKPKE